MKITQNYSAIISVLLTAAASFGNNSFVAAEEFQDIADVPQTAKSLNVPPSCAEDGSSVPSVMFTVETSDTLTVSTSPPDLLTVSVTGGGALEFAWNTEVASTATGGGVKIGFPAGQLESMEASAAAYVQILNGFSAVTKLDISGGADVTADLSSNATPLELSVSGGATLTLKSGSNVRGSVSGNADLIVATPNFEDMSISGAATVKVDGTVGKVSASGAAELTASGIISGAVDISGGSTVNGDLSGTVSISGGSDIYGTVSGTIENSGGSTVNAADAVAVDVSIMEQPMTLSGTDSCQSFGNWIGDFFSGSPSMYSHSCRTVGVGVLAGVLPWVFG